jgi:gluconokinase
LIIVVMGVSGSGKTTVGRLLAGRLGWPFYDGDDYHPPANVAKMSRGLPLSDDDRAGWLAALAALMRSELARGGSAVLACSALKARYRAQLRVAESVQFVYLKGDYDLILARMQGRADHFMKPAMLASQFAALEPPAEALTADIAAPPEDIVDHIIHMLVSQEGRTP